MKSRDVKRSLAAMLFILGGCSVSPRALPASHPASASAPSGRLAGAPATLRAGVVDYTDVPPLRDGDRHD
jgi:hypothetical protein